LNLEKTFISAGHQATN